MIQNKAAGHSITDSGIDLVIIITPSDLRY